MSIVDIIELMETAYWKVSQFGDEPLDLDDLPQEIADLWGLHQEVMLSVQALQAVRREIESKIADQLAPGEAVNIGDQIIRYKPSVKKSIHDEEQFWSFVQSLPLKTITELFRPNTVRISVLKQAAAELGLDAEAIEDTFFVKEFGPARVEGVDINYAPKWTHDMEHGERKVSPYARNRDDT